MYSILFFFTEYNKYENLKSIVSDPVVVWGRRTKNVK